MIIESDLEKALKPYFIYAALPKIIEHLRADNIRLDFSNRSGRVLGYYKRPNNTNSFYKNSKLNLNSLHTISLQIKLNPYILLFTFVHELAHLISSKNFKNIRPHGKEWKKTFKELILPFLREDIFPKDVLEGIDGYFKKTSRCITYDIILPCNKYGKNRDEFLKLYKKNIKKGINIPIPCLIGLI